MMKEARISFYSAQRIDPDAEDNIEFTTDGYYSFDGETACLSYYESEVTGMLGTKTTVTVEPEKVTVERDGTVTSRMSFDPRKKDRFQYSTPYGVMTLAFDTRSIVKSFDKNGGELIIDYIVDVEHAVVSRNYLKLNVTSQNISM